MTKTGTDYISGGIVWQKHTAHATVDATTVRDVIIT